MAATGLEPGRQIGRILAAIDEAAASGELTSVQDAIDLAIRLAPEHTTDGPSKNEGLAERESRG